MRFEVYGLPNANIYKINSMGYSHDPNLTRFGPAQRNNYIIHYVLEGAGFFNGNRVHKGQGFFITPRMHEYYYPSEQNPWSFVWAIFEETAERELFAEYAVNPKTHIFAYNNFAALAQAKSFIIGNNRKILRAGELYELFLHIFNHNNIAEKPQKSSKDIYCSYAMNFINANLFRKITVEELVKILGVSQPYLYHIFKEKVGVSPKQYMDMQKTEKAKELLATTHMSMTEIANSIGIEDGITFSKFFSRHVGVAPSVYAARHNLWQADGLK